MTGRRPKVLIVDDSATVRAQMMQLLADTYDCIEAADGREGMQKALAELPDAVVADLEMPVMDGIALLRAMRSEAKTETIPVVIATTVTAIERVNECRNFGCAGFVLKPVQKEYLEAKLKKLIR